jgi:hypothetical protein
MNEFLIIISEYSKGGPVYRFVDIPDFEDDAPGQMRESRWKQHLNEKLLHIEGTETALKVRLIAPRSLTKEDNAQEDEEEADPYNNSRHSLIIATRIIPAWLLPRRRNRQGTVPLIAPHSLTEDEDKEDKDKEDEV